MQQTDDSAPASSGRGVPETLPAIALAGLDGQKHSLAEFAGNGPLLVNFWATWCAPCRREIPLLMTLANERSDLRVVGIAVDFMDEVRRFADEVGIRYPVLVGEDDGLAAVDAFGVQPVFPFTVFADRSSRIVATKIGELHADEAKFIINQIDKVDDGRLDLMQARTAISLELTRLALERSRNTAENSAK
ncbi:MAG: TlpA disulfide reductase family protein [Steroidobacteraceae bacterium]